MKVINKARRIGDLNPGTVFKLASIANLNITEDRNLFILLDEMAMSEKYNSEDCFIANVFSGAMDLIPSDTLVQKVNAELVIDDMEE